MDSSIVIIVKKKKKKRESEDYGAEKLDEIIFTHNQTYE